MSDQTCLEFEKRLQEFDLSPTAGSFLKWLSTFTQIEPCISTGLKRTSTSGDWALFGRYVVAAACHPSRTYTSTLCAVLAQHSAPVNFEDIVEVLGIIGDPAALESIEETLTWEPAWDEYHQLAVKCVWALEAIGTPQALTIVRHIAESRTDHVGTVAMQALEAMDI